MERRSIMDEAEIIRIRSQLPTVFSPSTPISRRDLFAGRTAQIEQVLGAVSQPGQHVVLFGERGVGKTSLASLIHQFWDVATKSAEHVVAPRINCDATDTFATIWHKITDSGGALAGANAGGGKMVTIYFKNGRELILEEATSVTHEGFGGKQQTTVAGICCYNASGGLVGTFVGSEISGYDLIDRSRGPAWGNPLR